MMKTLLSILFALAALSIFANEKPNILVILADDLGYHDVGFTGCTDIQTPELDQLANNGMIFMNGYVTHPYCGPSRAALLTGRYQARFGMEINPTNSPFDRHMGLPLDETTFAKRMQEVGYRTGIIGKWHMGGAPCFHPNNRGFDYFYGFLSGGHSYFPWNINTTIPLLTDKGIPHYGANEGGYKPLMRNNGAGEFTEYLTTALSRDAAKFVKESEKPFMLYLAYNAPHMPLEAPKETIEKYKDIPIKERRTYAAMIDKMDEGIGMVISALKESGKFDNTIIFFLSDNGGVNSTGHNKEVFASNYPFKKGKGSLYEGGHHVPFIVHWPNGIKKTGKFNGLVSSIDIAATALALSGADTSNAKLDGVDLTPYLKRVKNDSPHKALYWRMREGEGWAVRTVDAKYFAENSNMSPLLFNMVNDPYENENIVDREPETKAELAKLWNQWNSINQNIIWLQANAYQKKRLELYDQLHQEMVEKAKKRPRKVIE